MFRDATDSQCSARLSMDIREVDKSRGLEDKTANHSNRRADIRED